MTARKLTISILDLKAAETVGVELIDAAMQLGVWEKYWDSVKIEEEFVKWLDHTKYRLSTIVTKRSKFRRLYKTGYTIKDQINRIITELAGEGNADAVISVKEIAKQLDLGPDIKGEDLIRTIYHNLDSNRLPANESNYWTQFLSKDAVAETHLPPAFESEYPKIFKSRFNKETDG